MGIAKRILSVVAGAAAAMIIITAFETGSAYIQPMPAHINPADKEAIAQLMNQMPLTYFLWLLLGYVVAAFAGGLVAALVSGRHEPRASMIVGIILTIGGVWNLMEIPHPIWFMIASTLCYIPLAWLGFRAVRKT
jgi:MFS family permease